MGTLKDPQSSIKQIPPTPPSFQMTPQPAKDSSPIDLEEEKENVTRENHNEQAFMTPRKRTLLKYQSDTKQVSQEFERQYQMSRRSIYEPSTVQKETPRDSIY
jgi:hypothetical protein